MANIELWGTGGCDWGQPAVMDGRLFRTDRTRYCRVVAPIAVCCSMWECMEPLAGMVARGGVEHRAGAVRDPNASKLQQQQQYTNTY